MYLPFNRPFSSGKELELVRQALAGRKFSGDGPFTKKCHALLEKELGVGRALLTTSCTHALEMTAMLLELKPGEEVIIPAFTFVSVANAFVLRGVRPVFADVRRDTLNLDETKLESLITPRTKGIVVVHYAGVGCEMDVILEIAGRHSLPVVEDNAHGLFGKYKGRYLGTFGAMTTQSFHETKNFTCGEGGALLINDARYVERAEIIREKGTHRTRFFRGEVDKYTWVDIGSSYLPSDILAAFLYAQFEQREFIQSKRKLIWEYYHRELADWADDRRVQLPVVPSHCEQAYHMFYLLLSSLAERQSLIAHLSAREINSVFHYLPLHLSDMGRQFGGKEGDCPVTEGVSDRLLRLPFYNELTQADQDRVIAAIKDFRWDNQAKPLQT
jgi:dTDP-4-amino-4,6-dideoxygalactose transaminase